MRCYGRPHTGRRSADSCLARTSCRPGCRVYCCWGLGRDRRAVGNPGRSSSVCRLHRNCFVSFVSLSRLWRLTAGTYPFWLGAVEGRVSGVRDEGGGGGPDEPATWRDTVEHADSIVMVWPAHSVSRDRTRGCGMCRICRIGGSAAVPIPPCTCCSENQQHGQKGENKRHHHRGDGKVVWK